jgi:hypothetical protein
MDGQEDAERHRLNIAFDDITSLIKTKDVNLSSTSKIYIGWAREYLKGATKSLDLILKSETYKAYFPTNYLNEVIIPLNDNNQPNSVQEAEDIKSKIDYIIKSLDKLKENPNEFYNTKASEEVFNYLTNILLQFKK